MTIDMDGDLIDDIRQGSYSIVQLRKENARLQSALATSAAAETDAIKALQECQRERDDASAETERQQIALHEARWAVNELLDYLERVADYSRVDANELHEFVVKTKAIYGGRR